MPVWWVLLALGLAGGAAWGAARLWRIVAIGAAYKARVLSMTIFGAGREVDPQSAPEVSADSYWLMRPFQVRIDRAQQTVTVSLAGLRPRSVAFRSRPSDPRTRRPSAEWAVGTGSAALARVVGAAFDEPDRTRLRRTRAIVVVQGGRIVAERYAAGFGDQSRLAGWSMTKSVLSALIGLLVADGRLSLRDQNLLPAWRPPDPRAQITLEDLLRMRSGLRFSEVYTDLSSDVVEMLFNQSDAAAYASSRPLSAPPGTVWSYSSGTSNILSAIARRVVGEEDYPGWPYRSLFAPIGMSSALLEPDSAGTFVGSSFMLATARDWARFGQLYLQDGTWDGRRILPPGWVQWSKTSTPQSAGMYGAHWWLRLQPELGGATSAAARLPEDAFFALGHEGQTLTIIPSLQLVVVRLGLSIYVDAWNHAEFVANLIEAVHDTRG